MVRKTDIYIDTSAFIAFLDQSDTYNPLFARLFAESENKKLITSPLVIAEGQGWFLRRYDTYRGLQFLNFIQDLSHLKILEVGNTDITEATKIIRNFSDQNLTLTDAVGLYWLKKYKMDSCWSTDRHLSLTGSSLVIHQY